MYVTRNTNDKRNVVYSRLFFKLQTQIVLNWFRALAEQYLLRNIFSQ